MNGTMDIHSPSEPTELVQLAEKVLNQPIKDGLVAYCPSMDLLGIVTADEQTQIFRLNGQRVLSIPARRGLATVRLCWKPNGSLLAIAYSDNKISLIALQGGKLVHQIDCPVAHDNRICSLGWGVTFTDVAAVQAVLASDRPASSRPPTLDDVVYRGFTGEIKQPKLDLPADIASLDVEDVLPKLSILPAGGKDAEVFTTRASIDTLFHSKDTKSSSADALIVGFEDGSAWLSVHDFFEVGRFDTRQVAAGKGSNVVKHAYHPYHSTQGLILRQRARNQNEISFVPLDLKLIGDNGRQFSLLAGKSTQLLNVLRYVKESQIQIYSEFESSQTLPQRFVANVEEDLQEKEQTNFKTAAYHLVATGDCSPVVKEWLVDQLGDRGQKRWEKAATSGYESTRKLLHENLLPALDRATILLSRLKGLSLFGETANAFGLSTLQIDHALDTVRCLHLLGHTALLTSDTELRQSNAFCAWLKQEIDIQTTEHPPASLEEADKEPTFDHGKVFEYIEGPLQRSKLYELFDLKHETDTRETVETPSDSENMYEAFKQALRKVREGEHLPKRLPGMASLVQRLAKQCSVIFGDIADSQQKKVRFGEPVPIGSCHVDKFDIRLISDQATGRLAAYVAAVSPDSRSAKIVRMSLSVVKNISSVSSVEVALISAKTNGEIFEMKFIDDATLCVGVRRSNESRLLVVPYHGEEIAVVFKSPGAVTSPSADHFDLLNDHVQGAFTRHVFAATDVPALVPAQIEINGRKGRRAVCVVSQDSLQYRVYDIDSNAVEAVHEDSGGDGEDVIMSQ